MFGMSQLVTGKLDQKARALVVEEAAGRDVQPERLPDVAAGLSHWCVALCHSTCLRRLGIAVCTSRTFERGCWLFAGRISTQDRPPQ